MRSCWAWLVPALLTGCQLIAPFSSTPGDAVDDGVVRDAAADRGDLDDGGGEAPPADAGPEVAPDGPPAAGTHLWSRRLGRPGGVANVVSTVDASGRLFVAGIFRGRVGLGGADLTSAGSHDGFVASYDASGAHRWSRRIGGSGSDRAQAVAVDGSGHVIVIGRFTEVASFGGGALTSAGAGDVFVANYTADGAHRWSRRAGGSGDDEGTVVTADGGGTVTVGGNFTGVASFGGADLTSVGPYDVFVASYDASGAHRWSRRFGGGSGAWPRAAAAHGGGDVTVAGHFSSTADLGGGDLTSAGHYDVFVASYDVSGGHRWSRRFGGPGEDKGRGVAVDSGGNVTVIGEFQGTAGFGATDSDVGTGAAVDGSGNVTVTGSFHGTASFGGADLTGVGVKDLFAASYDASGTHRWSRRFGGASSDSGVGVAVDSSGNVTVAGTSRGTVNFGGSDLIGLGDNDVVVASYGPDGSHRWSLRGGRRWRRPLRGGGGGRQRQSHRRRQLHQPGELRRRRPDQRGQL